MADTTQTVFTKVEGIAGKLENESYENFLLFRPCF